MSQSKPLTLSMGGPKKASAAVQSYTITTDSTGALKSTAASFNGSAVVITTTAAPAPAASSKTQPTTTIAAATTAATPAATTSQASAEALSSSTTAAPHPFFDYSAAIPTEPATIDTLFATQLVNTVVPGAASDPLVPLAVKDCGLVFAKELVEKAKQVRMESGVYGGPLEKWHLTEALRRLKAARKTFPYNNRNFSSI